MSIQVNEQISRSNGRSNGRNIKPGKIDAPRYTADKCGTEPNGAFDRAGLTEAWRDYRASGLVLKQQIALARAKGATNKDVVDCAIAAGYAEQSARNIISALNRENESPERAKGAGRKADHSAKRLAQLAIRWCKGDAARAKKLLRNASSAVDKIAK